LVIAPLYTPAKACWAATTTQADEADKAWAEGEILDDDALAALIG
jgi:hypothetical protein